MLEDELREMFAARVQTPPAVADPAGRAVRQARVTQRRRQAVTGTMAVVAFAAVLGGAAAAQGLTAGVASTTDANRVTFQDLFYGDQPVASKEAELPTMALPVDLLVGQQLWTSDGKRVNLTYKGAVDQIAKVPDGWVYSDDDAVRLLAAAADKPVTISGRATWAVSQDGTRLAANEQGTLTVTKVSGENRGAPLASSPVPKTAEPVSFFGERVLVSSPKGFDYWSASPSRYSETWNADLLAVFGTSGGTAAVGVVRGDDSRLCLVDVTAVKDGLKTGARLGCGDLVSTALLSLGAALSPDGRLLAVASKAGLQMIDLQRAREGSVADPSQQPVDLSAAASCPIETTQPLVWSDSATALAQTAAEGILACRVDGTKLKVDMPDDVTPGWTMIPSFGSAK